MADIYYCQCSRGESLFADEAYAVTVGVYAAVIQPDVSVRGLRVGVVDPADEFFCFGDGAVDVGYASQCGVAFGEEVEVFEEGWVGEVGDLGVG